MRRPLDLSLVPERRGGVQPGPAPGLLLVGDYPPPWGGISVHVRALHELALREGLDARVLDVGKGRREAPRHARVVPAAGSRRFVAELARAAVRGTLIHAHVSGNNSKAWLVALAASRARLPGRPAILTVHSGLAPAFLDASASHRRLARAAATGFTRVLCANAEIEAALERAGVTARRLEVLPAFAPVELAPGEPPAAARAARARHAPLLVAALSPGPQYGEDVLLEGARMLAQRRPGLGLVVFGPGTSDASFAGRAAAGLFGRVTALGEVDHAAALGTIALADAFVRPTRADGDSISVREALALGVRAVASDVGHRPPEAVLFRAGDPHDLADRVEAALARARPQADAAKLDAAPRIRRLWRELLRLPEHRSQEVRT